MARYLRSAHMDWREREGGRQLHSLRLHGLGRTPPDQRLRSSSGTGVYVSLAGYVGMTLGWVEGFEFNFFGAVVGFDIRRPALKLPRLGRFGVAAGP
jgi:hypothetical protein